VWALYNVVEQLDIRRSIAFSVLWAYIFCSASFFIFLKSSFSEKNSFDLKIAANGILIGLCCACGSTMGMPVAAVVFGRRVS
jgi:hypothetical protein